MSAVAAPHVLMTLGPQALLFDGRSTRAQPVRLHIDGDALVATPEADPAAEGQAAPPHRWPLRDVRWPERTRHGQRVMQLADGARLHCAQVSAFDAWAAAHGRRDPFVVRLQRSWRGVAVALLLTLAVLATTYRWGVPLAAQGLLTAMPPAVDASVGERALQSLQDHGFKPSSVPAARQAELRQAFAEALARAHPEGVPLPWLLEFRAGAKALGPNAMALPGGTIVVTDALVELLADRPDALLGVLAHEWGHVRHRHGMQGLVRATLVGALASLLVGDFSTLLAAAPVLLVQQSYSRDFEREADAESVRVLRAAGHSPAAMVEFFERVRKATAGSDRSPVALSSHPDDEERVRYFEEAARRR